MTLDRDLHERMVTLAKDLLDATKAGRVPWRTTDEEGVFLYDGTKSSVTVDTWRDRDGDMICTLSLRNNTGAIIDSLKSEFITAGPNSNSAESWNETLEDLFYAARRVAYNVDDALEGMLTDIRRGTPFQEPQPNEASRSTKADDPWDSTAT